MLLFKNCQLPGQIRLFFPNGENIKIVQVHLNHSEVLIPISWVLLDYGSTISSICNNKLVDNIRDANVTITAHTNDGSKYYTQTESLHFLPLNVHFIYTSLANILFLSEVESHHPVNMDTTFESAINVHINYHTIVKFLNFGPGLYYFDTAKSNKPPVNAYSFLSTVKDRKYILIHIKLKERIELAT